MSSGLSYCMEQARVLPQMKADGARIFSNCFVLIFELAMVGNSSHSRG